MPAWTGAEPCKWTMDLSSATNNAAAADRWTILLYTGSWWCPHCQPLEAYVLLDPSFREYVEANGYYLVAQDFPYRDNRSNWCWLYETNYVQNVAGLTMEQARDAIDEMYKVQDAFSAPGAALTTASNWTDTVEFSYHRVGYPTLILLRPDGREAGRFSYNKSVPQTVAVDYVTNRLEQAKSGDEFDVSDGYAVTAPELPWSPVRARQGDHTLSLVDVADWVKLASAERAGRWTFYFEKREDLQTAPLRVSLFSSETGTVALAETTVDVAYGSACSFDVPAGDTYCVKITRADASESVVGYRMDYACAELPEEATPLELSSSALLLSTDASQAMPVWRDENGDGLPDLMVGVKETLTDERGAITGYVGRVRIYLNSGTAGSPQFAEYSYLRINGAIVEEVLERNSGCQGLQAVRGDFDGDGMLDLAIARHWGELDVYFGTATPEVYLPRLPVLDRPANSDFFRAYVTAVDFDGDGRDELVAGFMNGSFKVLEFDAARTFQTRELVDASNVPLKATATRSTPAVVDFTGDGLPDLLSGDLNGDVLLFPAVGLGGWSSKSTLLAKGAANTRSRIAAADVDGDGRMDVVVGYADGKVCWQRGSPRPSLVCEPAEDGYMPGLPIAPIELSLDLDVQMTISAVGIPSGLALKYDRATGRYSIQGTPTKPFDGEFTVTVKYAAGGIARTLTEARRIVIRPLPVLKVEIDPAGSGSGAVSGAGGYLAGKKVSVRATPDKRAKSVFAGWYLNGEPLEIPGGDFRQVSLQFTVPATDETVLVARFENTESDHWHTVFCPDTTVTAGRAIEPILVQDSSFSFPTITVKGLPAGLKFDAKSLAISGTATKPGTYDVVITAKNVSKVEASHTARFTVANYADEAIAPLEDRYAFTAGIVATNVLSATVGCSVSGLPSGLRFDKTTGTVQGTPLVPGLSLVTFSRREGTRQAKASAWFYVAGAGDAVDGSDGIPVVLEDLTAELPPVTNGVWSATLTQGVAQQFAVGAAPTVADMPAQFTIRGLPSGLSFNARTGLISGAPTQVSKVDAKTGLPKPAVVVVSASNKARWKGTLSLEITVKARPDWAVGTYNGAVAFNGTNGLFTATVSPNGSASGKYVVGRKSYSFRTTCIDRETPMGAYELTSVISLDTRHAVTNTLSISSSVFSTAAVLAYPEEPVDEVDQLTGFLYTVESGSGFQVTGAYQDIWQRKDKSAAAYHLPLFASGAKGTLQIVRGTLTFAFGSRGRVTVTGKIDGRSVSASTQLLTVSYGLPSCYCFPLAHNGLVVVSIPNSNYFSIVEVIGDGMAQKISGMDGIDLLLSASDQVED